MRLQNIRAVQKSPRDWRKNNNFAAALIGQDRYDEAVVFLRGADDSIREKSPYKWIVEFNLAFALEAVDPGNQESKDLILKAMTRRHKLFDEDWQATVVGDRSIMNRLLNYPEIQGARRSLKTKTSVIGDLTLPLRQVFTRVSLRRLRISERDTRRKDGAGLKNRLFHAA